MVNPLRPVRGIRSLLALTLISASLGLRAQAAPAPAIDKDDPKGENPQERARFRMLTLKNGKGEYNPNDLLKAKQHVKTMTRSPGAWPATTQGANSTTIQPLTAGIQPASWTNVGPGNVGGRTRSILPHPTNPDILYLGSVSGGIWKTVNRGVTWAPLNDFMANLAVGCMVMDKNNPNVIYAGTGESYPFDGIRGAGVFKTTDGGATWNQLASTANPAFYYVNRLAISPASSQVLLASTNDGLYRSADGGVTWTQRVAGTFLDADFHPTNGSLAIASGYGQAWYSSDAGVTWTLANTPPTGGRWEITYARSSPTTVFASVDNNMGECYRSTDGGHTYSLRNTGLQLLSQQGWYDNAIWVDPTNANNVMIGGVNFWLSTDAGTTFSFAGNGIHTDHHIIVEAQGFPATRTVYVGNDGGVWKVDDYLQLLNGASFSSLNNSLAITQFYGAAGNLANGMLMGGTQDNGTPRYAGTFNGWLDIAGGDGGWTASDPVLNADGSSIWYGEYQNWFTYRVKLDAAGNPLENFGLNNNSETNWLFIPPQILDPNSTARLYKGGSQLWRLDNPRTQTVDAPWVSVKPAAPSFSAISAIAVAPGNSNIIWVGHSGGEVYSTSNGLAATPTWTQRNASGTSLPNFRHITRVTIDPTNSNRVYVTIGGYAPDNIWKSEDGGATWTDITSNLPDAPVRTLVVNKANTNFIYAGTEVGIFASENRGASWSPSNEGPANVSVDELFWVGNKLVAATHGRGMFSILLNAPPVVTLTAPANNSSFPAGPNITLTATASDPDGSVAKVEFYQGSVKLGEDATSPYSFTWTNVPAGSYSLTAKAIDANQGSAVSAAANITVTGGSGLVRNPLADAHVRDGSFAANNFGTATLLEVKTSTVDFNRDAYLRFDLSGLTGLTSNAKLRVFAKLSEAGSVPAVAYGVDNITWTETGITWNNRPLLGSPQVAGTFSGTTAAWYEFNVTQQVRKQRANGQPSVSLALHGSAAANPLVQINSRENSLNKPELVFTQTTPAALLVVGSLTLNTGDVAIRNRLQALGYTVTIKDGTSSAAADATGKAVVVISSTITSASVNTKFRTSTTPVVNCEQALQDDFGMTGTVSGTDFGNTASQTQVKILNPNHLLSGGQTGTPTVTATADAFNWGKPNANAAKIAAIVGDDTKVADYGYDKGAAMVGLTAPARRVNLFPGDIAAGGFNASGWSLFDAAVLWASGF